jgi:signal transduction histidine kinase
MFKRAQELGRAKLEQLGARLEAATARYQKSPTPSPVDSRPSPPPAPARGRSLADTHREAPTGVSDMASAGAPAGLSSRPRGEFTSGACRRARLGVPISAFPGQNLTLEAQGDRGQRCDLMRLSESRRAAAMAGIRFAFRTPGALGAMLRLSHKLFVAFALIVGVVVSLAGWSLLTTQRLTAENRAIIQRALPAVRLEVSLLEGIVALRRVEARQALLRDPAYVRLFAERAKALENDLTALQPLMATAEERQSLTDAMDRFRTYRMLAEQSPGNKASVEPAVGFETLAQRLYAQSNAELNRRGIEADHLEEQSRIVAPLAIGASLVVSLLVAGFASIRIARPLRRLRVAASAVEQRTLADPIPVHGRDEIAELTSAFNRMATRLRELDTLKEQLFSAVTHDMRTPLMVIAWSAERLGKGTPGTLGERQATLLENIRMNTSRLLGLVSQLLDLGKLRSGKLQLELYPTDLATLARDAMEEIRPWAEDRGLRLELAVPDAIPKLLLDAKRMHQVLVNLLGNAVKFNRAGGRITLHAESGDHHVNVSVSDTGVGIPAQLQSTIFERYEQAHGERGGTGLGLAIVKCFVEAHGGRIAVESEEGRGSCFTVTLPLDGPAE